ncbi:MAG: hypothetical protein AB1414_09965 [bacterium]
MNQHILVEIEMPTEINKFKLSKALNERLQYLLDKQDGGEKLTISERMEAEELVNLAEFLSLLSLRARKIWGESK